MYLYYKIIEKKNRNRSESAVYVANIFSPYFRLIVYNNTSIFKFVLADKKGTDLLLIAELYMHLYCHHIITIMFTHLNYTHLNLTQCYNKNVWLSIFDAMAILIYLINCKNLWL